MFDQAIIAFNKVISIKPDHAEAYSNMSVSLQEQGKLNEAVEACKKAIYSILIMLYLSKNKVS